MSPSIAAHHRLQPRRALLVMSAKQYQVVQTRFAAVCPVLYVVSVDKSGAIAGYAAGCSRGNVGAVFYVGVAVRDRSYK